jgi:hypothetical protein
MRRKPFTSSSSRTLNIFSELPMDTQQAVAVLLSLFDDFSHPRPVYQQCLRKAQRLLKVMGQTDINGQYTWILSNQWRSRLELAGLNPDDPMDVVDPYRWALACHQLDKTGTFRDDIQRRWITENKVVSDPVEVIKAVTPKACCQEPDNSVQFKNPVRLKRKL